MIVTNTPPRFESARNTVASSGHAAGMHGRFPQCKCDARAGNNPTVAPGDACPVWLGFQIRGGAIQLKPNRIVKSLVPILFLLLCGLVAPCHGGSAFGTYTNSPDAISKKLPAATWDRGRINLRPIQKDASGNLYWSYNGDWTSYTAWGSASGFASIPNDRSWVLYMASPTWHNSTATWLWSSTPGVPVSWTDYENVIRWTVSQLPPQVKAIEVDNEPTCAWSVSPDVPKPGEYNFFPNVAALAEYIRHTYDAVKSSSRPDLLVLSPSFWTCSDLLLPHFNELANYSWDGVHHTFDYVDGIAQHAYNHYDSVNSQGVDWSDMKTVYGTALYQEKRFALWYEELEGWFANLRANPNVRTNIPVFFTEFGWKLWIWNGTNGYPDVTQAQHTEHLVKGYAALAAQGVTSILMYVLEGNLFNAFDENGNLISGRGINRQDASLLNLDLAMSPRPSWYACDAAFKWLKNVGAGTHSRATVNGYHLHTINFGTGSVVWSENPASFAFNTGRNLSAGQDQFGVAIPISGGSTITVSQNPVLLTHASADFANQTLYSVQFLASSKPVYTGAAVFGNPGDQWNKLPIPTVGYGGTYPAATNPIKDVTGSTTAGVTFSNPAGLISGVSGYANFLGVAVHSISGPGQTFTYRFANLPPNASCDLVAYTYGPNGTTTTTGRGFDISVNGSATYKLVQDVFGLSLNNLYASILTGTNTYTGDYIRLDDVTVDAAGALNIVLTSQPGQWQMNVTGFQLQVDNTPASSGAVSRRTHGGGGAYDIPGAVIAGQTPGPELAPVECRASTSLSLVVTFNKPIGSGQAAIVSGIATVSGAPVASGNTLTMNLTGVGGVQTLRISLSNVTATDGGVLPSAQVSLRILQGDVNEDGTVNSIDVAPIRAAYGKSAGQAGFNARADLNADGVVNAVDLSGVRSGYGAHMP